MLGKLFKKLSGGKQLTPSGPSRDCALIRSYLGCECEYIPAGTDPDDVRKRFSEAEIRCTGEQTIPVLISVSDNLTETLFDNAGIDLPDGDTIPADDLEKISGFRAGLITQCADTQAEDFLRTRVAETAEDEEFDLEEEWGGDEIYFEFARDSFSSPFDYDTGKSGELLLARIPASEPWHIAAWLPMGGWNECPAPEDMLAMAKRWYEKYRAVICCVTSDEMEFRVSTPPTGMEEAYALAKEQYYFCQDRVEQYADEYNLRTLADTLTKSPLWYFWWD